MGAPKKPTKKFQIQLDTTVILELGRIATETGALSANALAADWIRQKLKEYSEPQSKEPIPQNPGFDFKDLFFRAQEELIDLRKIILNLSEKGKNTLAQEQFTSTGGPADALRTPEEVSKVAREILRQIRESDPELERMMLDKNALIKGRSTPKRRSA